MKFGLGLGLGRKNKAGVSASFSVALTGLTGGVAIIGTHASISYTTDPVSATETVKWSASSDPGAAATYGTGASPTDFTSADGFSLYLHVTDGGETVTRSALVRKAQATGGVDLDLSFPEDSAIASTDLTANWTTNGNTLTYAIVGTALPAGLSVSSAGAMTGTPTTITADATYTLRGTDEYGRTTDDTFTLEITAAPSATITIDTLTYTRGTAGVAPDLATTVSSTGTTTANYTLRGVAAATAQTEAQIDASGNKFDITASTLAGLDGSIDLSNSVTAGVISAYVFDSSGTAVKSAVVTTTGVTYDAAAPAFSSAEVGTIDATSLIVTFDKALYGSTSAADWDVQVAGSPATESAAVISGSTVDITLGTAVTNGQAVTVAYTGTGLVGVDAEQVATFTAQSVTNNVAAAGFTPQWMQFDGSAWLERNSDMTGIPSTTTSLIAAFTYSPSAGDIGSTVDLFAGLSSVNKILTVQKGSTDRIDIAVENNADAQEYRVLPTGNLTSGAKYLILISVDTVTNGFDAVVINLADGTTLGTGANTGTGATLEPPSSLGWAIAARSGTGTGAPSGQLERAMVWFGTYADVSTTTVQQYFHDGSGGLIDPADVVTSIGATPILNISGADLADGTNSGSGGAFTKDGAGSITAV